MHWLRCRALVITHAELLVQMHLVGAAITDGVRRLVFGGVGAADHGACLAVRQSRVDGHGWKSEGRGGESQDDGDGWKREDDLGMGEWSVGGGSAGGWSG